MRYLLIYTTPDGGRPHRFVADAARAGVLLAAESTSPGAGTRIVVAAGRASVCEVQERGSTGVAILDVRSAAEALAWAKRVADEFDDIDLTVRPIANVPFI